MDIVLEKIHYNPECFSKIVEDFEDYVAHTEPEFLTVWKNQPTSQKKILSVKKWLQETSLVLHQRFLRDH